MPRTSRKKRLLNPNQSQLLFKEAPINGPKHEYGPQLRSAIHPRSFISEEQRRGGAPCTSWVSPQFNSFETKAVGRGKRTNQTTTRISNKASVLSLPQTRRTTVCKYTPLSFNATRGQGCENLCENIRNPQSKNERLVSSSRKELQETPRRTNFYRKGTQRRLSTRVTSTASKRTDALNNPLLNENGNRRTNDYFQSPNTSSIPEPPNVETPEMPHCFSTSPSDVQHLLLPQNQATTPPRTENPSILVEDTPEKDYGVRVTWRRRKGLMKLLIDRGQLLLRDAEVANEWF